MSTQHGTIEQISSKTFSWNVESVNCDKQLRSSYISLPYVFHYFSMCISLLDKKAQSRKLYLCEENKNASYGNIYDFIITLKYVHKEEVFVKGNVKPEKRDRWFFYDLETIKTDNLLKITCTFLKRDASSEKVFETNKTEFVQKQEETSEKRKVEEDTISKEQSKTMKDLDTLSKNLKEAFLSEEDSDITIKVGDEIYAAHKVFLKNRSPVFQNMLQHDMTEKNEAIIYIDDCDPRVFRDFLLYVYTGKLDNMTKENVCKLYCISDKYDVNELKLDCIEFILNNLDVDIILDVLTLSTKHQEQNVLKHAMEFFTSNAKAVFLTEKWQLFVKEHPKETNKFIIKAFESVEEKKSQSK